MKKAVYILYILFFVFFFCAALDGYPATYIIGNPDLPLSSLKPKELKDIFTGKKTRWNGGGKIVIATLKDSDVHRDFLRKYVKKTPSQFRNFWRRKVFTGEGQGPKRFADEASLMQFVAKTKGAVGYMCAVPGKKVKVIEIRSQKGGEQ